MSWAEAEPESFTIMGLAIRCTPARQREIVRRMKSTPAWREWHALDSLIRTQHVCSDELATFRAHLDEAQRTAEALARAEAALTEVVTRIVNQVEAESR